ncbi:conjugal transfer protein TraN [Photobacterium damselae]|uniref:conjugal transfer protein TraN n=1 Tax=Photobacterium damselae TaxID=38293 RepID=UPI000D667391|nr:conjugal transfer protein TraN [Photobacterium damselae]AWK84540.1 hypothetical protein BST98_21130 [Photobacterium damselae]MBE8127811.1 conjugal transfer protein TraN [Photobacterium damselae subsp. piscicida]MCG3823445.1 conjugal transfer protein TraN [Photobacterium damselae]
MKYKSARHSSFQRITSATVALTYTANTLTLAFAWVLFSMSVASTPAAAGINSPVSLIGSCPANFKEVGGSCIREEKIPAMKRCESGYSLKGENCEKNEDVEATGICKPEWSYSTHTYRKCTKPRKVCPPKQECYWDVYTENPQRLNCPEIGDNPEEDAYGQYTPKLEGGCNPTLAAMGGCNGNINTVTIDNRWKLNGYRCQRTLKMPASYYCKDGYTRNGNVCERVDTAEMQMSCPPNYYQEKTQCFPGPRPSCPVGTALKNGSCVSTTNHVNVQCPSGKVLDPQSHTCINPRQDSEPTKWTPEDYTYFFNEGMDLGRLTATSVIPADNTKGQMSVTPVFLDPTVKVNDPDNFGKFQANGIDQNNGFSAPDGTYQNEDKQTDYVRHSIDMNNRDLKKVVTGNSAEEIVDATNHTAQAYGALMDTRNINPPRKISMDSPMFANSKKAVGDAFSNRGAYFGDCNAETTTYQKLDPNKIIKQEKTCFKPAKSNLSGCVRRRIPIPPSIEIIKGLEDSRVSVCGEKCIQLTLGKTGNDYLPQFGKCGIYTKEIIVRVKQGINVERATITRTHYDDQFRLYADNNIIFNGVHMKFNTPDGFPTEHTACEQSTSRNTYNAIDVTPQFKSALANDNEIKFLYKVGVGGAGEAYGVVDLIFDKPIKSVWGDKIIDIPSGCTEALNQSDKHCTNNGWQCDEEFKSDDPNYGLVNVSKGDRGDGYGLPANLGDALVLVARRDFDIGSGSGTNCGMVVATTWNNADGNDDDGIYFCDNRAGIGTHMDWGRQLRGSNLTNILPTKGKWEVIAGRVFNDRLIWYRYDTAQGKVVSYPSRVLNGGSFDSLKLTGFRIARSRSANGLDWFHRANNPLWFAYWQVLNNKNDDELSAYMSKIALDQPWLQFKPLYPHDNGIPICMEAHAKDYVCDPLKGKRLSYGGATFGFKDILKMPDQCNAYDKDQKCDAISKECVTGWFDKTSNTCYAWNEKYSCEDHSKAMVTVTRKNNTCFTQDQCIDGSCDVRGDETNKDFTNALSQFAVLNEIGMKKDCAEGDMERCRVFKGKPSMCSQDQFGLADCCEAPVGVTAGSVFKMAGGAMTVESYMASADGAFGNTGVGQTLQGIHKSVGDAVTGVWDSVKKPIGDAVDSVWGSISSKFTGATANTAGNTSLNLLGKAGEVLGNFKDSVISALTNLKDQLLQEVFDMMPDALQKFVEGLAVKLGAAEGTTGAQALNSIGSEIMSVVSFVGWMYSAYQLAKLAYQMIMACKEEEQKVSVDLIGKKCFYVYTKKPKKKFGLWVSKRKIYHCCFPNVLSRIIMEQASAQMGWSKKTFFDRGCNGLSIEDLGKVDFGKIDFSEWINMMAQNDMIPVDRTQEDVTGGNIMNGYDRLSTDERMKQRGAGEAYSKHVNEVNNLDIGNKINCNTYPRPQSCDTLNMFER